MFQKATKKDAKLRLALCGPAGSGKTYSLLSIATALGGKIAAIDTERGSMSKYADIFDFDDAKPEVFDPRELVAAITAAEEQGYTSIIIDSLSHYWMGKGGELDMVDAAAKRSQSGNSFTAWKNVTPHHNALIDKIISARLHVLVGMRTKTEWVIEEDSKGKKTPRKIGLAPVMRDGIEFEFDVCGDLDQDNTLTITKSRCPALSGAIIHRPGKDMANSLLAWLKGNAPADEKPKADPKPQAAPTDPSKPWNTFAEFLEVMSKLKESLGEKAYYAILGSHGFEHANQLKGKGDQAKAIFAELSQQLEMNQEAA